MENHGKRGRIDSTLENCTLKEYEQYELPITKAYDRQIDIIAEDAFQKKLLERKNTILTLRFTK